ncbi:MAG: hypothetical protein II589_00995, partial [Clostridia bacterium]|nr:hypothetical protein [Clostridia bacterium]
VHLHRIFSRHIAQKILTYVSMPAILLCNLPTKSTAHLNDGRFLEMPLKLRRRKQSKIVIVLSLSCFVVPPWSGGETFVRISTKGHFLPKCPSFKNTRSDCF